MKPVTRDQILDYVTYGEQRDAIRDDAMAAKQNRRIHVGGVLTFLFENRTTVRYQILEMVRVEKMVKEAEIQHELETYNELLGGVGELGCTMMIEIDDIGERDVKLRQWLDLPERSYVELEDGRKIHPTFDARQKGDGKVSSVQFLKFDTSGAVPVAIGVEVEGLKARTELTDAQRAALRADLGD
jgi:hypothetical protein